MKNRRPWRLIGAALLTLVAACGGTAGKAFDTTHVRDVKSGQSQDEVVRWFGDPFSKTTSTTPDPKGCVQTWLWKYGESGGGKTMGRALIVKFGPDGAVCDSSYAETNQ